MMPEPDKYPYTALIPVHRPLVAHFVKANAAVLAAGREILAHEKEHGPRAGVGDQLTVCHLHVVGVGQRGSELELLIVDALGELITKWQGEKVGGFFCGVTQQDELPCLEYQRAVCIEVADKMDSEDSPLCVDMKGWDEINISREVLRLAVRGFYPSMVVGGGTSSIYKVEEFDDDA